MRIKRGYPLAIVILSLIGMAVGCADRGEGLPRIFVSVTPPGTAGFVAPAGVAQPTSNTPTLAPTKKAATAVPVPGVTPTRRPILIVTNGTFAPESTAEPDATTTATTTAPEETVTPVAVATPTLKPTPTSTPSSVLITLPTKTPTPVPTATVGPPLVGAGIIIECIFYDGQVASTEADEYVQIFNQGSGTVNLFGWRLTDVSDSAPEFKFPGYELLPQRSVRVYTNEEHPESGGFSFKRGSSVWNNDNPDTAGLYDPQGSLVFLKSYPPGC